MLGITKLPEGGGSYYLSDLAAELGPGREPAGQGPGEWVGGGARGLGLQGAVEGHGLAAVLSGRHPGTDRELSGGRRRVGGFDLTFSAPKSVSVLFALGRDEVAAEVVAAHRSAVGAAMGYVHRRALTVRRGSGDGRELLATGGPVAASFAHGLSRALDPHLHTHVVLANLAHGTDGRWSAVDGRGLFAHRAAIGSLYEAHLRDRLTTVLGVEWEPRRCGRREIAGTSPAVLGGLSSRSAEIRAHLAGRVTPPGRAGPSGRARRVAWAATREAKVVGVERDVLVSRWRAVARDAGLTELELDALTGHRLDPPPGVDERRFAAALMNSPHAVTTRRGVLAAWADALPRGGPAGEVERSTDWVLGYPDPAGGAGGSGTERGVRESALPLAAAVPRRYLLNALGARPISADHQRAWREAADAIDGYRDRWGVTDRVEALGGGIPLARLPARQLADRLRTSDRIGEMLRRLGRERGPALDRPHLSIGRD